MKCGNHEKEYSGFEAGTTNNRMELTGIIKGLEELKYPCKVTVYSDSKYVVDAINKGWVNKWQSNNWIKPDKNPAKNPDLWVQLLNLMNIHDVVFVWVKGHESNEYNNRCDQLAVTQSRKA